jgi:hypothetical protein
MLNSKKFSPSLRAGEVSEAIQKSKNQTNNTEKFKYSKI